MFEMGVSKDAFTDSVLEEALRKGYSVKVTRGPVYIKRVSELSCCRAGRRRPEGPWVEAYRPSLTACPSGGL